MNKTRILLLVCILLLAVSIFFGVRYYETCQESNKMQNLVYSYEKGDKVVEFTDLFIAEVLQSDKEVDFETRLKLENAVRDLQNEKIYTTWKKFVDSKDEAEAQKNVEDLLGLLVKEIMKK